MSNLCYNCGDCHLPQPCPKDLKICEICAEGGHAFNFCPMGVRRKIPDYQYWALCHNCDQWHLPEPCKFLFVTCQQCGGQGHKEYFCPILPLSRGATRDLLIAQQDAQPGAKRQGVDDDGNAGAVESVKPSSDMIRSIKERAARDAIMLYERGVPKEFIGYYIRRDPTDLTLSGGARSIFQTPGDPAAIRDYDPNVPQTPSTSPNQDSTAQHQDRFASDQLNQGLPITNVTPTPVPQARMLPAPIPTSTISNTLYAQPQPLNSLDALVYPKKDVEKSTISQILEAAVGTTGMTKGYSQATTQAEVTPSVGPTSGVQHSSIYTFKDLLPAPLNGTHHDLADTIQTQNEAIAKRVDSAVPVPTAAMKAEPKSKKTRGSKKKKL